MTAQQSILRVMALASLTFGICSPGANAQTPEPRAKGLTTGIPFISHDGHAMFGKLTVPNANASYPVVIYVQTAEGATVDMKRPNPRGGTFNYYDLYREKLAELNVAFFSYEGRGVRMGGQPPRYELIDWDIYNTSTLDNKVRDILSAVRIVQKQKGIDASQIFLMGTSEGTLLAAEAASRIPEQIKGLILYAVLSSTLKEALTYMAADGNFLFLRSFFDTDSDGAISRQEFDTDPKKLRERAMKGVGFGQFDRDGDGIFTVAEMRQMRKTILDGIDSENVDAVNGFLKATAAVSIPNGWVKDHFSHAPMWTFLSQLKMPIGLFHGAADNLTSIEAVRKLEQQAKRAEKSNMHFHYFDGLDHTLGIVSYFAAGKIPEGHKAIFEYITSQVRH